MKITIENATRDEIREILEQVLRGNNEVEIVHPTTEELAESKLTPVRLLKVGEWVHSEEFGDGIVLADDGDDERNWPYRVEFDDCSRRCTASTSSPEHSINYVTRIEDPVEGDN